MTNNPTCKSYQAVEDQAKLYITNPTELKKIAHAFAYAQAKHEGQLRNNGDPYLYHLLSTAYNLALWHLDPATIQAGFLHDVLEDTPTTFEELVKEFGSEIANLVAAVTKVSHFAKENRNEIKADYLRKLYLSLAHDIRVIIIKLADRLHNIRTIEYLKPEKQKIIAQETLEVYASIAHRLGMRKLQQELEDLSFRVLNPQDYQKINNLINADNDKREKLVEETIKSINQILLAHNNLQFRIYGRSKSIYSIYRKMYHFGKDFNNIHDILAIRIICQNIDDCYMILGYIHQHFMPLAKRFKDYIAAPKNNLYQSLHTAILYKNEIYELQIRTEVMEDISEVGAAAHWRYKEGDLISNKKKQAEIDEKLNIFQAILDLDAINQQTSDRKYLENEIKQDLFSELIYVLTPNGKVITLPLGSTILDFAYKIHTEVGEKTVGARVNGIYSSLNTVLKTGDIVEIKTAKTAKPNHDWLTVAKTNFARHKIKKFLMKQDVKIDETNKVKPIDNSKKIMIIKDKIDSYIAEQNIRWRIASNPVIARRLKSMKYQNYDDFCLGIANGAFTIEEAVTTVLFNDSNKFHDVIKKPKNIAGNNIDVENSPNIKTNIALCCLPVAGEPIVGYITKGQGIKAHRTICPNVTNEKRQERSVSLNWKTNPSFPTNYQSALKVFFIDRPGLLVDLANILNHLKIPIIKIDTNKHLINGQGVLNIVIKVSNIDILHQIISSMKKLPDVIEIKRSIM